LVGTVRQFFTFPTRITSRQAKDTGMAMVLILLILGLWTDRTVFFRAAVPVLVLDMVWPMAFYPLAVVWLGLSHMLGTVVSKILLSIVFFVIVLPVALVRRVAGKDSLQLRRFKATSASVMRTRNHVFVAADIEKPY
jgi:hypothetical protein